MLQKPVSGAVRRSFVPAATLHESAMPSKPSSELSLAFAQTTLAELTAQAEAAETRIETSHQAAAKAKIEAKRARKAYKQARKAAKEARKQAKALRRKLKQATLTVAAAKVAARKQERIGSPTKAAAKTPSRSRRSTAKTVAGSPMASSAPTNRKEVGATTVALPGGVSSVKLPDEPDDRVR